MSIKLKGSTDGSVSLDAPADTSPSGTDVSFTLPTADGTAGQVLSTNGSGALSFVNAITEVDLWRLTANKEENGTLTDLARSAEPTATYIGTGMSVSGGVFTFPSTGKYLIVGSFDMFADDSDTVFGNIAASTDSGANWNTAVIVGDGNNGTGAQRAAATGMHFMDVTNTSTHKIRFTVSSIDGNESRMNGGTIANQTHFLFVRLGDT
jgi:hypothetical protein